MIHDNGYYTIPGLAKAIQAHSQKVTSSAEVAAMLWQMVVEGVVMPGEHISREPAHVEPDFVRGEERRWGPPYFTLTPLGRKVIAGESVIDPLAVSEAVRSRFTGVPTVALEYLAEAATAYARGLDLATTVLLGVAAESMAQHLYGALAHHLTGQSKSGYEKALSRKQRTAAGALEVFAEELERHSSELRADLCFRFKNIYLPLSALVKINRDDSGHAHATRIGRDAAYASLASLPAIAAVISELEDRLGAPCLIA